MSVIKDPYALPQLRLTAAWAEIDRQAAVLKAALADWSALPACERQPEVVESDAQRLRLLDQILFRFLKLQDAVGERLIPATLEVLAEPIETMAMRDRLTRLEKLGFLEADTWLTWRALRNRITHEYPDHPEARWAVWEATVAAADAMLALLAHWRAQLPPSAAKSVTPC